MKPPDDNDGQQGHDAPAALPQLPIILIISIAAVTTVAVWPNTAPAVELVVSLLAIVLDVLRQTNGPSHRD